MLLGKESRSEFMMKSGSLVIQRLIAAFPSLQKWSEKWECYVDVDVNDITKMKDGDRIAIIKNQKK